MSRKAERFLARTADEAKKYAVIKKVLVSLLTCLVIIVALAYIVAILYSKYGSLTVSINKYDVNKYSLTLSETPDFKTPLSRLNAQTAEDITNISYRDLPENLDMINGVHNGDNYLAYTFYLKNAGVDTVTYEYYMYIVNVVNHVDEAIRIRIYKDGEPVTYAKPDKIPSLANPNLQDEYFLTEKGVARVQVPDFAPGDTAKFTVVIWLEGDDPECVDELIGGALKTDMYISVVETGTDRLV